MYCIVSFALLVTQVAWNIIFGVHAVPTLQQDAQHNEVRRTTSQIGKSFLNIPFFNL